MDAVDDKGKKLNTRTFAIKIGQNEIFVCVPVLYYKRGDPGFPKMQSYFTGGIVTGSAVALDDGWCEILPMNSSTNPTLDDDDD